MIEDPVARRAREVRVELGLGDGPVPEIVSTLERLGLSVLVLDLEEDGPEGAYLPHGDLKVVLLNSAKYLARLRFTAAHELGHHIFHDGAILDRDFRDARLSESLEEQRANNFAACFLMPDSGILARLGSADVTPSDVVSLALEFGVSYESLAHRLQKLRRVSVQQKAVLLRDRAAVLTPSFRQRRMPVRAQLPSDYVDRALRAYDDWRISYDRLTELLHAIDDLDREELQTWLREQSLLHEEDDPHVIPDVPAPAPPEHAAAADRS